MEPTPETTDVDPDDLPKLTDEEWDYVLAVSSEGKED